MRTSLQLFFNGFTTLVLCLQTSSLAFSQVSTSKTRESEFVIQGMANERESLKSGMCTITYVETYKTPTLSENGPATLVHFWFAEDNRYRIDCTKDQKSDTLLKNSDKNKSPSPVEKHSSSSAEADRGYFIHTKDRNIGWEQGSDSIQILPPDTYWPVWVPYFDVKAFGTNSWLELQEWFEWNQRLELWSDPSGLPTTTTIANDICTMIWQLGDEDHEWVLEVNTKRGFTPFHGIMRNRKDKKSPWLIEQEIKTTWERKSLVWVPVHFELHTEDHEGKNSTNLTMTISWEKINSEIPPEVFSYQSLGVPDGVGVLDSTLGTTVVVKPSGTSLQIRAPAPLKSESKRSMQLRAILAGAALLLLPAFYYATFRLRQWLRRMPPEAGPVARGDHGADL